LPLRHHKVIRTTNLLDRLLLVGALCEELNRAHAE